MRSVRVHAALLVVATVLALVAWLRDTRSTGDDDRPLLWRLDTLELRVGWTAGEQHLAIEWRAEEGERYAWAVETRPAVSDPSATDTLAYPLGLVGQDLLRSLATLRALRDLGDVDPSRLADFGLDRAHATLRLGTDEERHELVVGDSVFRSGDRYARDPASGNVYVLPSEVVEPLQVGSGAIRERSVHVFPDSRIARVRVLAGGQERVMERSSPAEGPVRWAPPGSPDRQDATFANFMERLSQLAIADFERSPQVMPPLIRVEYMDEDGAPLGFVELSRGVENGAFYLRSERTRVPARAVALLAERVAQDIDQLF